MYQRRSGFAPSSDGLTLEVSLLVTHSDIFERVLQYLDFHDLSQLLKAGTTALRQSILEATRHVASGTFEPDRIGAMSPLLPRATLATICGFSSLETLTLVSPLWALQAPKRSPLLDLPSTLRHFTLAATIEPKQTKNLLTFSWSSRMPNLETFRVNLRNINILAEFELDFKKLELPPSLRVLSFITPGVTNITDLTLAACHPIGYKLKVHKKRTKKLADCSWSELYHLHPVSDRQAYNYRFPCLRVLELLPPRIKAKSIWPDLSILPPHLDSLLFHSGPALLDLNALPQDTMSSELIEASNSVITDFPPSSLKTLMFKGLTPPYWISSIPPSVTRLCGPPHLSPAITSPKTPPLFPLLRHCGGLAHEVISPSNQDVIPAALVSAGVAGRWSPTKMSSNIAELAIDYVGSPPFWELHTWVPANLRTLKVKSGDMAEPRANPLFMEHFSALQSLDLNCECIRGDFLDFMPPNLTRLSVVGEHAMHTDLKLENTPPRLQTLIVSFLPYAVFVMPRQLAYLPKTLRFLALPMILVDVHQVPSDAASGSLATGNHAADNMVEEIIFDFDCLPLDCVCVLQFRLQGHAPRDLVGSVPASIKRKVTRANHFFLPQRAFAMAESQINF